MKPHNFAQSLLILGNVTDQIQIQLVTWGVTNRDMLLLTTLRCFVSLSYCAVFVESQLSEKSERHGHWQYLLLIHVFL